MRVLLVVALSASRARSVGAEPHLCIPLGWSMSRAGVPSALRFSPSTSTYMSAPASQPILILRRHQPTRRYRLYFSVLQDDELQSSSKGTWFSKTSASKHKWTGCSLIHSRSLSSGCGRHLSPALDGKSENDVGLSQPDRSDWGRIGGSGSICLGIKMVS